MNCKHSQTSCQIVIVGMQFKLVQQHGFENKSHRKLLGITYKEI